MSRSHVALALALAALAVPASAGVVMEFQDRSPGEAQPTTSKAWSAADRVRVDVDGTVMIFRGDKQVAWIVQPDNTYMELTKDGIPGMADAMKEMQAELANLPPDQRALVESMMKQQMGGQAAAAAPAPSTEWKPNGKTDTVAGRACTGWDGTRGGRVEEQVCAADWSAFGLTPDDFRGFEAFAEFMKGMSGPMAQQASAKLTESGIPGVPLRSTSRTAQGEHVHEVTKLEKADVPASLFELPAGARAQSMDDAAPKTRRGR